MAGQMREAGGYFESIPNSALDERFLGYMGFLVDHVYPERSPEQTMPLYNEFGGMSLEDLWCATKELFIDESCRLTLFACLMHEADHVRGSVGSLTKTLKNGMDNPFLQDVEDSLAWNGFAFVYHGIAVRDPQLRFTLAGRVYETICGDDFYCADDEILAGSVADSLLAQVRCQHSGVSFRPHDGLVAAEIDISELTSKHFLAMGREYQQDVVEGFLEALWAYDLFQGHDDYDNRDEYYAEHVHSLMKWPIELGRMALWMGGDPTLVRDQLEGLAHVLATGLGLIEQERMIFVRHTLLSAFIVDGQALKCLVPVTVDELAGCWGDEPGEASHFRQSVKSGIFYYLSNPRSSVSLAAVTQQVLDDAGTGVTIRDLISRNPNSQDLMSACLDRNQLQISVAEFIAGDHLARMSATDARRLIYHSKDYDLSDEESDLILELKVLNYLREGGVWDATRIHTWFKTPQQAIDRCIEVMKRYDLMEDLAAVKASGVSYEYYRKHVKSIAPHIKLQLLSNDFQL